jgi:CBS domain containing-hemolysin-like protein
MSDLILTLGSLLLALFLVFLNGLFVAAEFAFVRVRPTRVRSLVEEGQTSAKLVKEAIDNLDDYLAVCQLGITIASLSLGWIGEPAIAALIGPFLETVLPSGSTHLVSAALGFGVITFFHVVFGELAPKTFSIQDAEKISFIVAPPMKFFYYLFMPGVIVFNGTANAFTRLLGVPPASETEETHTEEDIRALIAQSREHGMVEEDEREMIEGVFELNDTFVREIMVPRPDVKTFHAEMTLEQLLVGTAEQNHTSYPVLNQEDGEQVIGSVHVEDMLRASASDESDESSITARDLTREVLTVPENRRIDELLADLQTKEIQMAVVFDEWGSFEGIVTIEDILEEIVGEIRDEFDAEEQEPSVNELHNGDYAIDGRVPIQTLNDTLETDFESESFETTGGLVLDELGRAPGVDDQIQLDGYTLNVDEVDGTRISTVIAEESDPQEQEQTQKQEQETEPP